MITITESSRQNPCELICDCGEKVNFAIHHEGIDGTCVCGKTYFIPLVKTGIGVWNCCSKPENGCGYNCERGKTFNKK